MHYIAFWKSIRLTYRSFNTKQTNEKKNQQKNNRNKFNFIAFVHLGTIFNDCKQSINRSDQHEHEKQKNKKKIQREQ